MLSHTLVVHQPSYLPWLGYFDLMDEAQTYVFYDDVQFDKRGWRSRNRIKSRQGSLWLTVPVETRQRYNQRIIDVRIAEPSWASKHLRNLQEFYRRAPYFDWLFPRLAAVLTQPTDWLVEVDIQLTTTLMDCLGITVRWHRSSALGIDGDRSSRLLNHCRHFGATRYLTAAAAQAYLDTALFREAGIEVAFQDYRHPVYPQLHGDFVSHLSVVDLLFNCGPESLAIIRQGRGSVPG